MTKHDHKETKNSYKETQIHIKDTKNDHNKKNDHKQTQYNCKETQIDCKETKCDHRDAKPSLRQNNYKEAQVDISHRTGVFLTCLTPVVS